jgi:hypothetical protein
MQLPIPKLIELVPAMLAAGVLLHAAIDRAPAPDTPAKPMVSACLTTWGAHARNAHYALFPVCPRGGVL